jgi:hypothetical protein
MLGRDLRGMGHGETVNISSKGILFVTDRVLALGRKVEVLVDWPVKLNEQVGLKFIVLGKVGAWEAKGRLRLRSR